MRGKLVITAGGLVLTAALGVPLSAQAAVTHSGPALAQATEARPDALSVRGCNVIYDQALGDYATDSVDNLDVYFKAFSNPSLSATEYCNVQVDGTGKFEIWDGIYERCLAVNTAARAVTEDTTTACNDEDPWTEWTATNVGTYHGHTVWRLKNVYLSNQCLYDDNSGRPAIYTTCSGSGAERFVWDALP